jgi:hypothetical protein
MGALRGTEMTAPGSRNDVKEDEPTCGAEGQLNDSSAIWPVQKQTIVYNYVVYQFAGYMSCR